MTHSPEPVDTFSLLQARPDDTPGIRNLRYAVIAMGIILLFGVAAVITRIAYLASRPPPFAGTSAATPVLVTAPSAGLAAEVRLALPPGARVHSHALSGNRLSVHYESPAGDGIMILDLETGRPVSQIRIEPAQK